MATDFLRLFAARYNFKYHKSQIFGIYNGYDICIGMQTDTLCVFVNTQVVEINSFLTVMERKGIEYGIVNFRIAPPLVAVYAQNYNIKQVLDFVTQLLTLCKSSTWELCPFCNERLKGDERVYFSLDEVVCVGHDRCVQKFSDTINDQATKLIAGKKPWNKLLPFVVLTALIYAVVLGLLCIYFLETGNFIFLFGGYVIGGILCKVYRKNNGKGGVAMYVSLLSCCLVVLFAIQTIYRSCVVADNLGVIFLQGLDVVFSQAKNVFGHIVPQVALGLVCAAVGILTTDAPYARAEKVTKIRITKL